MLEYCGMFDKKSKKCVKLERLGQECNDCLIAKPIENIPKTILLERLALREPKKEEWRKDNMEGYSLQTIRYLAALNVYNEIRELIEDWDTCIENERSEE